MRKLKFFALILSLMAFLGAFAACNQDNSSSQSSTPTHTCESVCEECGKCTDEACTEEACEDKCAGHTVDPEPEPEPEVPSNDTQATFDTFEKTGEYEYSLKVSNSTETLAMESLVSVNALSSWTLSSDVDGNQTITDKILALSAGDNTYYVLVTAEDGSTQLYTLKIRRKPLYDVVFDVAGGTSVANQQVEEDGFAVAPETTKVGYDFTAWDYDFTTPITENKTVVASWAAKEYTITYNAAGGSVANATTKVTYDSNYTLEEPARTGYEFLGWYLGDDKVESGKWETDTDITLTATWGICEYTIQYDLKGGIVATANPTAYTVEDEDLVLTNPTREHYIFLGWTGTELSEPTTTVTIVTGSIGNREYVALWQAKEYTITYHLDGGENDKNNPSVYTIESDSITLKNPTRENYTFDGWYTSGTFDTATKITAISKGSTGDLNLYAKWTAITSDEEDEEEVDNLPNVTITQTRSQYVTSNDYSSVSTYAAFTAAATPAYLVPGLKEGLIPQSMDVWEAKDLLLISGYFASASLNKSGSPSSMIVAIDLKTGNFVGKYCLKNVDGTNHTGHVGGLAVTEKNIFISSGRTLYRIPLSQMEALGKSGTLQVVETIKVAALGSFCNYSDGVLWVGDFINTTEVPVLPDSVSTYTAWAVGYKVKDTESEFSSENWDPATMSYATPDYALSITNKVQGLAFVNGKVALSTSYGRSKNSKIYVYNSPLQSTQDASITVNGKSVPVWILDGTFLKTSYTLMPMSEGLSSYNGKLLVVFESGTLKYNNATNPTDHVWSVTLPE